VSRVLLTGATGFIGGHIAWSLVQRGYEVVALVRPGKTMTWEHDSIEVRRGDIRERDSLRYALADCDSVIHAAAIYSLWTANPASIYEANVLGTRNVMEMAVDAGIERIVYTSTVGTTRFRSDRLADESDLASPRTISGHYKRSKFEAERLVRRMAAAGAPIVTVNPTAPVGPADVKPTPTGAVILDFLKGRLPAYVDTGLNYVDVTDVADGHVLAMELGVPGQRYLLGNVDGNLTLREMLTRLSRITGLPAPKVRIPLLAARVMARVDNFIESTVLRREPRIPMEGVRMAHQMMWVDPSKAVRDLGMPQHPIDDTLARAVRWFVANEYAPSPPSRQGARATTSGRGRTREERVR
jgi:dihydroflavonol-4-reductase